MNYETIKQLKDSDFKRLTGVQQETQLGYDDILVEKSNQTEAVLQSLERDTRYKLLYDNSKYAVFGK